MANNLQPLGKALKRNLDESMQAQYRAGYINGDLELTSAGKTALMDLLADKYKEELTASAREDIKETESNED